MLWLVGAMRDRLQRWFASGFWFPRFVRFLIWFRERASLVRRFELWLEEPRGAPEFYEVAVSFLVAVWLLVVARPVSPFFSALPVRLLGSLLLLYWITELFLFALHWVFAATGPITDARRSLATFALNLPQLALLTSLTVVLLKCDTSATTWQTVYQHLHSVFALDLAPTQPDCYCRIVAHYEVIVAGTLLLVVIANLVSAIDRVKNTGHKAPERSRDELRDALTHIASEFVGLELASAQFQKPADQGGDRAFDLEAALIHARNLTDFFWAPSGKRHTHQDGIYAVHYLPTGVSWPAIRTGLPQFPNVVYDALSSQLAHISIARSAEGARDFEADLPRIVADLTRVWQRWHTELQGTTWASSLDAAVTSQRTR